MNRSAPDSAMRDDFASAWTRGDPPCPDPGRRRFIQQFCAATAALAGLPAMAAKAMAQTLIDPVRRPSVIWLHFQECTGCTESLLRTSHPALAKLITELISLDYHETLFAAAGHQAEKVLHDTIEREAGKFLLVVEGAIPTKHGGVHCRIGGRTAKEILETTAPKSGGIFAIGSCASFGGLPAADPNPTGAVGVPQLLAETPVVTIPGCPANPYNFLATALLYLTFGQLPATDALGRPLFAYGRRIHDDCPRRPQFDAGRFAKAFGDEYHRMGYCLYELGCKGPQTHARCATKHFCEVDGAWPIGIGHPCVGCTEQSLLFRTAIHQTVEVPEPDAASGWPEPDERGVHVSPWGTGLAGLIGGALAGAGLTAAWKLRHATDEQDDGPPPGP